MRLSTFSTTRCKRLRRVWAGVLALGVAVVGRPSFATVQTHPWSGPNEGGQALLDAVESALGPILDVEFGNQFRSGQSVRLADGSYAVAVWGASSQLILLARVSAEGALLWSAPGYRTIEGGGYHYSPTLAASPYGGVLVAWYQTNPRTFRLRKLSATGAQEWESVLEPGEADDIRILVGPDGKALVTYEVIVHEEAEPTPFKGLVIGAMGQLIGGLPAFSYDIDVWETVPGFFPNGTAAVVWLSAAPTGFRAMAYYAQAVDLATAQPLWPEPVLVGPAVRATSRGTGCQGMTPDGADLILDLLEGDIDRPPFQAQPYQVRLTPEGMVTRVTPEAP